MIYCIMMPVIYLGLASLGVSLTYVVASEVWFRLS